jgi:hypothetical protein
MNNLPTKQELEEWERICQENSQELWEPRHDAHLAATARYALPG